MSERLKNFLWLVLVLVIFSIVTFVRGSFSMYLDLGESAIVVSAPQNFIYQLPYENIADVELIEEFESGTMVDGNANRQYFWGTWENEAWGQYTLCAAKKIDCAILIRETNGNILVINYESEKTTASLAEMLLQLIESKSST